MYIYEEHGGKWLQLTKVNVCCVVGLVQLKANDYYIFIDKRNFNLKDVFKLKKDCFSPFKLTPKKVHAIMQS